MLSNSSESAERSIRIFIYIGSVVIPLLTVALLYFQSRNHIFIYFDDVDFIGDRNPIISNGISWKGIQWAFGNFHMGNYIPLTWISYMADYELFGENPGIFALHNACLHAANSLLISILISLVFRSPVAGLIGGVVFGAHPVLVEGVAWIAQRKTPLATLYFLLSVISYWLYLCKSADFKLNSWYYFSIVACLFSLLSKGMYITTPFILLLIEFLWHNLHNTSHRSFSLRIVFQLGLKSTVRMAPFLLFGLAISLVTVMSQHSGGAISSIDSYPITFRLHNIINSYVQYIRLFLFPIGLSVFYPLEVLSSMSSLIMGTLLLVLFLVGLWILRSKIGVVPLVGFLFFLITLFPVIGLVQIGGQAYADRYLYGPILGLILLFIGITSALYKASSSLIRLALSFLIAGWTAWVIVLGFQQVSYWSDSTKLALASISSVGKHRTLMSILATDQIRLGNFTEARTVLDECMKSGVYSQKDLYNLAIVELALAHYDSAINHIRNYLEECPNDDEAKVILALCYHSRGDFQLMTDAISSISDRGSLRNDFLGDLKAMESVLESDPSGESL